jgi:hypothetical protein
MPRNKQPTLTTKQIVALVEIGEDRLAQIEQAGFIKRAGRNRWSTSRTLAGLVEFYRNENRRGPKSAADARWRAARARELEVRTAERERKLMRTDEAMEALEDITGVFLTELSGLPASVTRDLALRRKIEERIFEMRNRISNRLEAQARSLQERGRATA